MSKRRETPDVLAEILGGASFDEPAPAKPDLERGTLRSSSGKTHRSPRLQWDYVLVTFQDYKGWRPRFINGAEVNDWMGGPLIHEYLEQMGEEGWELTAASAGERLYGNADNHQLYFKRQR